MAQRILVRLELSFSAIGNKYNCILSVYHVETISKTLLEELSKLIFVYAVISTLNKKQGSSTGQSMSELST